MMKPLLFAAVLTLAATPALSADKDKKEVKEGALTSYINLDAEDANT